MKIAYLYHWNQNVESGVMKKILSQVSYLRANGNEVRMFQITNNEQVKKQARWDVFKYSSLEGRYLAWENAINKILKWNPDLVYHRYDLFYPPLSKLAKNKRIILEINTNDKHEYCRQQSVRCWYNKLTRHLLFKEVVGFIFVTNELSNSTDFKKYVKNYTVISNGINLQEYRIMSPPNNSVPRIVFLGSEDNYWQGVDKILYLANCLKECHFDLVGINKENRNYSNVIFHGFKKREEYEQILSNADIAIGTMALHRKGMFEACPIKTREYLAFGIPTIIGYSDTDFTISDDFLLQIPNTPENILRNTKKIRDFIKNWKGTRVKRDKIEHIDFKVKEKKRFEYFKLIDI